MKKNKIVFMCHPWKGMDVETIKDLCKRVSNDVVPISPALYFNQFLNDDDPDERKLGINMGLRLMWRCDEVWVYRLGRKDNSKGMDKEINYAEEISIPVRYPEYGT